MRPRRSQTREEERDYLIQSLPRPAAPFPEHQPASTGQVSGAPPAPPTLPMVNALRMRAEGIVEDVLGHMPLPLRAAVVGGFLADNTVCEMLQDMPHTHYLLTKLAREMAKTAVQSEPPGGTTEARNVFAQHIASVNFENAFEPPDRADTRDVGLKILEKLFPGKVRSCALGFDPATGKKTFPGGQGKALYRKRTDVKDQRRDGPEDAKGRFLRRVFGELCRGLR